MSYGWRFRFFNTVVEGRKFGLDLANLSCLWII